jgi:dATP pyrophosphohydrolase
MATVPRDAFSASREWPPDIYVIPEYCFAVDIGCDRVALSAEHTHIRWARYDDAREMLKWDGNRNGLWELKQRLDREDMNGPA